MKKLWILVLVLGLIGLNSCKENSKTETRLITASEMNEILRTEGVQLIDVRTESEYKEGHIVNAQNIDFRSPTFDDDITKLDKEKPVIVYCQSGGRSAMCAEKLKEAGFEKVFDLEGGISKWRHSKELQITSNP